jgi:hypothetical protein
MPRSVQSILPVVLVLAACGSGDALSDPSFERWCEDRPCAWQTTGETRRVGSWHPDDYAVELVADDATISQVSTHAYAGAASCFAFSLIAQIEPGSQVYLELDFQNDGSIDFQQPIPDSRWQLRTFEISPPSWYTSVKFIVRKAGPGQVILAELRVRGATGQCIKPRIPLNDRPDDAICESDDQCRAGRCSSSRCGSCQFSSDCGTGQVCTLTPDRRDPLRVCRPRDTSALGQRCFEAEECRSGVCFEGSCSECDSPTQCVGAQVCERALPPEAAGAAKSVWPLQCAPKRHLRQTGEACVWDADCASERCSASHYECADVCDDEDADAGAPSCPDPCEAWLVTAGTCD